MSRSQKHISALSRLAGQTAVYGVSSIVGRFLNYLLVPLYTYTFAPSEYGVVTELYAYAGFLLVFLTYGMETTFFRFLQKEKQNPSVFSTALFSLLGTTAVFVMLSTVFLDQITESLKYQDHKEYIVWFILIMAFDVLSALPFAKLRAENKAKRFASYKIIGIAINIGLNLFFILLCPKLANGPADGLLRYIYSPDIGIGYIFISNLVASGVTLVLMLPSFSALRSGFRPELWKPMVRYALPLAVVGLAGVVNEMLDRAMLKTLLPFSEEENLAQLGIYGAVYKLSVLMLLFTQAFRYAADPFFFAESEKQNARQMYADVMKYFSIVSGFIFLVITLFIDLFKHFIGTDYHSGLHVVPILLMAYVFFGILVNLSIWYKLSDKTHIGALIAIVGATITLVLNLLWIPTIGYLGSAWATLICYASMVVLAYITGRRYYPIPYDLRYILGFITLAVALYSLSMFATSDTQLSYLINFVLLSIYIFAAYKLVGKGALKELRKQA